MIKTIDELAGQKLQTILTQAKEDKRVPQDWMTEIVIPLYIISKVTAYPVATI